MPNKGNHNLDKQLQAMQLRLPNHKQTLRMFKMMPHWILHSWNQTCSTHFVQKNHRQNFFTIFVLSLMLSMLWANFQCTACHQIGLGTLKVKSTCKCFRLVSWYVSLSKFKTVLTSKRLGMFKHVKSLKIFKAVLPRTRNFPFVSLIILVFKIFRYWKVDWLNQHNVTILGVKSVFIVFLKNTANSLMLWGIYFTTFAPIFKLQK